MIVGISSADLWSAAHCSELEQGVGRPPGGRLGALTIVAGLLAGVSLQGALSRRAGRQAASNVAAPAGM